jgi:hypothetical protein
MGFYYHLFMTTFLPCFYGMRIPPTNPRVEPQPMRAPFGKIK